MIDRIDLRNKPKHDDDLSHLVLRPADATPSLLARIEKFALTARAISRGETPAAVAIATRLRSLPPVLTSIILTIIIPSLAAILYLAFIASDQYEAEIRLAIRTQPSEQSQDSSTVKNALSAAVSGSSPQTAGQEAYIVAQYLKSRAALDDLSKTINVKSIFQRPEADFWARLKRNPTAEEFQTYWASMARTAVDMSSGILTAKVRAFRPEDAKLLADAFVEISEKLVNVLSERARRDALQKAEQEVRRNEGLVRDALTNLRHFRDKEGFLDPISAAKSTSQLLLGAMAERARLQSDLFVISKAMSSDAPTAKALKDRLESIDLQIDQMRGQLTSKSAESASISAALVKFEELDLQRIFTEKLYELSQNALERARMRAEQKQLYLTVFLPAFLPEEAKFPERLTLTFIIPITLLILWSIVALTIAAVREKLT